MAINFPNSPTTGETFQQADRAWQWDGEKWKSTGTTSSSTVGATVVFEGATDDAYETTLTATDPTADRTITLPNASGTVAMTSGLAAYLPLAGGAVTGAITTNSTFDGVDIATRDAVLTSTTTTANAALPKAGGTLTGAVDAGDQIISKAVFKDVGETLVTNGTSGSAATIDLENGNFYKITLTANCTLTFSNPPASGTAGSFTLFLVQDGTGSRTVTWPGTVDWADATAPTLTTTAAAVDVLTFITLDGGTVWNGFVAGQAMG